MKKVPDHCLSFHFTVIISNSWPAEYLKTRKRIMLDAKNELSFSPQIKKSVNKSARI